MIPIRSKSISRIEGKIQFESIKNTMKKDLCFYDYRMTFPRNKIGNFELTKISSRQARNRGEKRHEKRTYFS